MLSYGFPPLCAPGARVLILGSLPGRASLRADEYYANVQNQFWRVVAECWPGLPATYAQRTRHLTKRGIALWDVLAAATRSGSLDSAIGPDAVSNNFRAFFHAYPSIQLVGFNGATAAALYRRHVLPTLNAGQRTLPSRTLASTSPAHARTSFADKVKQWRSFSQLGAAHIK